MHLEGSCHCGKVKFTVESAEPIPFMRCYCSICRKTAGTGGYAINLGAVTRSMKVTGKRYLRIYRARMENGDRHGTHASTGRRYFCSHCGTALWLWDPCLLYTSDAADAARERALHGRLEGAVGEGRRPAARPALQELSGHVPRGVARAQGPRRHPSSNVVTP